MADLTDLKDRCEAAYRKREDLASKVQRAMGRLEESERSLEALRAECRAKNIDPDKIDEIVQRLETALETSLTQFEGQLALTEQTLEPFMTRK